MLRCKGTSCNQFYICRVLHEYVIVLSVLVPSKHQSMVFYSSALEGALVHKN